MADGSQPAYAAKAIRSGISSVMTLNLVRLPRFHAPCCYALPLLQYPGALLQRLSWGHRVPPDPAPMDFNAWMKAYIGGRWYTFDPRHNARRIGRILIARGRDAADIPMIT